MELSAVRQRNKMKRVQNQIKEEIYYLFILSFYPKKKRKQFYDKKF